MESMLVIGNGHLAERIVERLEEKGRTALRIQPDRMLKQLNLAYCKALLKEMKVSEVSKIYIVDSEDRVNIQFALAAIDSHHPIPVVLTLFNEKVAPHLRRAYPNLTVYNPAELAAPYFVEALDTPLHRRLVTSDTEYEQKPSKNSLKSNRWLISTAIFFSALVASVTIFFHISEHLSWVDAIYFVITVATTTGFGDISLRNSTAIAKIVGSATMILAVGSISIFFSLLVDRLIQRRAELLMGRRKYTYRGHIILCGLGKVGYFITKLLLEKEKRVVVIEKNENNEFLHLVRELGAQVFIGDATLVKNISDAGVRKAQALISVVNDDLKNLEIGLNARSIHPAARLILRIFDEQTALEIKEKLDIHLALSTSEIVAEKLTM